MRNFMVLELDHLARLPAGRVRLLGRRAGRRGLLGLRRRLLGGLRFRSCGFRRGPLRLARRGLLDRARSRLRRSRRGPFDGHFGSELRLRTFRAFPRVLGRILGRPLRLRLCRRQHLAVVRAAAHHDAGLVRLQRNAGDLGGRKRRPGRAIVALLRTVIALAASLALLAALTALLRAVVLATVVAAATGILARLLIAAVMTMLPFSFVAL